MNIHHKKNSTAWAAKTFLIVIIILSMQWTNLSVVSAYAEETESFASSEEKIAMTRVDGETLPIIQSTEPGVIEEADLSALMDCSDDGITIGVEVPERENREINGFLNIFFQWEPGGAEQAVKLFFTGTDAYIFLPSFADRRSLIASYDENEFSLWIDDRPVKDGDILRDLKCDTDYPLRIQFSKKESASNKIEAEFGYYILRLMQSQNLPAVYIKTFNGTMDYIDQQKQNYEPGTLFSVNADGTPDASAEIKKIHLRGNYSMTKEQKSYTVVLREKADLFGLGAAKKWCLIGSGGDPTRLRNPLSYSLAHDLGLPFAVDCCLVDMYCNGEYHGLTLLAESVEIAENRIEPAAAEVLLKVDSLDEDSLFFTTTDGRTMEILFSESSDETDAEHIRDTVNEIYEKIEHCTTPEQYSDLSDMMDMKSFAISYLISALTNELDRNDRSTFYYLHDDKLYAGPVWDFDHAYGGLLNERSCDYRINAYPAGPAERLMLRSVKFRDYLRDVALENADTVEALKERLPELAEKYRNSLKMTCIRFPKFMDLDADFGDLDLNLAYFQHCMEERIDYIWDAILNPDDYCRIVLSSGRIGWVRKGETLTEDLLQSIRKIHGWGTITYINGQDVRLDLPVTGDLPLTGS